VPPRVLAAPLLALALAGCGAAAESANTAEDFSGEERKVAQAVEDLQDAASRGDAERLCSAVLSAELVRRFEQAGGESCRLAVEEAIQDADTFELRVEDVTIEGDKATARVQAEAGDRDDTDDLQLVREQGRWKVSALRAQA
jgi:hypothetical protein